MKLLKYLITGFAILIFASAFSQPWMKYVESKDGEANFYEKQEAFNKYWSKRKVEKGKGYKQFKRWEYFMEPRVDKNGYLQPDLLWNTWKKEQAKYKNLRTNDTANWVHLGPDDTPTNLNSPSVKRGSGRINCISFHPTNQDIIYAGAPSGGFWKSTDGGNSWITTTDHLPSIGISDIAVHPTTPSTIFIATGDGDAGDTYSAGILKSTDGGDTWGTVALNHNVSSYYRVRRLKINPNNPSVILAASNYGILRSDDGGQNWNVQTSGHFIDLEFKPSDPNTVYAATYTYSGGSEIYRSSDGGVSWTSVLTLSSSNRIELAVTPANNSRVYALASDESDNGYLGMWRSDDSGNNFTQVHNNSNINLLGWSTDGSDSGGQGWYDLACAANPTNADLVYAGGVNTWKSTDGGSSWSINTHWYGGGGNPYIHADQHTFDFSPHTGELFSGNDGGIHKTGDGGNTWTDISDGLQILQIYRMGASETNPNRLVTGTQDNGTMRLDNGNWNAIIGGDGMECLIDYTNDNIIYGEVYYGRIRRSTDGGYNFTDIQPAGVGDGAWVTPFIIDPMDPKTLYIGFDDVYKTIDRGSNWTAISNNLTGGSNLRSLAISDSDNEVIYAATYSNIHKTTNGGSSWTDVTNNLPSSSITYIEVSPANPSEVWVTLSGYNNEGVYHSTDGGANWTNISSGLPQIPVNCITYENNTNNALYAGTDLGVYYKNGSMSSWIPFSQGLPNVIVNELEIQYNTNKIRAATYGRGAWESDLYQNIDIPVANFNHTVSNACEGNVSFISMSSGSPDTYFWDFGDGQTSTQQSPSHSYSALGTYSVKLRVSNSMGMDSITKTVDIISDTLTADFTSNISSACQPGEIEFISLSDDFSSFEWDFGDGGQSFLENPSHTYTDSGSFDVSLTGSTSLCADVTELKQDFINFDPGNSAQINMPTSGYANDQICCQGTIFDNGGEFSNYSDNTNSNVKIMPSDADQIEFNFQSFDVEAGNSGCNFDNVTIYDGLVPYSGYAIGEFCNNNPPSGSIITDGPEAVVKQYTDAAVNEAGFELLWQCLKVDFVHETDSQNNMQINFTDISTNYPTAWQWDFDDGGSSSSQNPDHIYSQNGIYDVTLTVTNAQGTYTETKQVVVGNVQIEETENRDIEIFPNPADEAISIRSDKYSEMKYELISPEGKIVKSGIINSVEGKNALINLNSLPGGVYNLRIKTSGKTIVKQISII